MASVAQAILIGNLGRDPETRFTPNGAMNVSFTMATNRRWTDANGQQQENTTWFRVTAWGRLGESLNKLAEQGALVKGRSVFVSGSFDAREYTDRNGLQRMSLDVNANDVRLLGGRGDETDGSFVGEARGAGGRSDESMDQDQDSADLDDVPF
ncbi:MAG: single-stranded DNA-binding protein [Thermomicrobiales bacterium]|jgi:single-strand DNA-binding protein